MPTGSIPQAQCKFLTAAFTKSPPDFPGQAMWTGDRRGEADMLHGPSLVPRLAWGVGWGPVVVESLDMA